MSAGLGPALLVAWAGAACVLGVAALQVAERERIRSAAGVPLAEASPPRVPRRRRPWRRPAEPDPGDLARLARALASSLRAGRTLTGGFGDAVTEAGLSSPLAARVGRVLDLRSVGVPLDRALSELSAGARSRELTLLTTLLRVGRRAGTGLPALLEEFAASMRERADALRDIRSLTVQARMSGRILTLLPLGFFVFVAATSARDVLPVLRSPSGVAIVAGGLLLQGVGGAWVRRIVRVEV